jgi:hypothetical protein
MLEKKILKLLWILGLILFPATLFKHPIKERWIVFLLNGVLNQFLDNYLVSTKRIKYPIRIKNAHKFTKGSILYDTLLCPLVTVWYHQATKQPKHIGEFIFKSIIFVLPQISIEIILEKYTKLINYKNGWKWFHSFGAIMLIKLFVRGFIEILNRSSKKGWSTSNERKQSIID